MTAVLAPALFPALVLLPALLLVVPEVALLLILEAAVEKAKVSCSNYTARNNNNNISRLPVEGRSM